MSNVQIMHDIIFVNLGDNEYLVYVGEKRIGMVSKEKNHCANKSVVDSRLSPPQFNKRSAAVLKLLLQLGYIKNRFAA